MGRLRHIRQVTNDCRRATLPNGSGPSASGSGRERSVVVDRRAQGGEQPSSEHGEHVMFEVRRKWRMSSFIAENQAFRTGADWSLCEEYEALPEA